MRQKIYNVCNKKDYDMLGEFYIALPFRFYKTNFKYYFVNNIGIPHYLNGPSAENTGTSNGLPEGTLHFSVNGFDYIEEEYWKHPDVIAYQYLLKHPELESFV